MLITVEEHEIRQAVAYWLSKIHGLHDVTDMEAMADEVSGVTIVAEAKSAGIHKDKQRGKSK